MTLFRTLGLLSVISIGTLDGQGTIVGGANVTDGVTIIKATPAPALITSAYNATALSTGSNSSSSTTLNLTGTTGSIAVGNTVTAISNLTSGTTVATITGLPSSITLNQTTSGTFTSKAVAFGCAATGAVTAPCSTSGTVNTTGIKLLVVAVAYAGATAPTLTSVSGNSFGAADVTEGVSGITVNVYHIYNPTASTVEAITATQASSSPALVWWAVSGTFLGSLDATPTKTGLSGTSITIPSFTPAGANEFCVSAFGLNSVTTPGTFSNSASTPAFSTPLVIYGTAAVGVGGAGAYYVTTGTTALSAQASWTTTSNAVGATACYK